MKYFRYIFVNHRIRIKLHEIAKIKMPSKKQTTDLKMPVKGNDTVDKRYKYPQFTRTDGKRDNRTTPTHKRK